MTYSFLSTTPFFLWRILHYSIFPFETPDGSKDTWLNWQGLKYTLCAKVLQDCNLGFFATEAAKPCAKICCTNKEYSAFLKLCLLAYFLARLRSFNSWYNPCVLCFAIIRYTQSIPSACPTSRWRHSCFEQFTIHLNLICAFQKVTEQGRYAVFKSLSYIFASGASHFIWLSAGMNQEINNVFIPEQHKLRTLFDKVQMSNSPSHYAFLIFT